VDYFNFGHQKVDLDPELERDPIRISIFIGRSSDSTVAGFALPQILSFQLRKSPTFILYVHVLPKIIMSLKSSLLNMMQCSRFQSILYPPSVLVL
jgi:hypothetical protein